MACVGKYCDEGDSPATFPSGPTVCAAMQATAWDNITMKCFKIFGWGVTIEDTTAPFQGGFEVFNANIHMVATQPPCVNCYQLASAGAVD